MIEETAESQGRPEVQDAMMVRKALAEGSFTWSDSNLAAMRQCQRNDDQDLLYAKTLILDDCHFVEDSQSIFKKNTMLLNLVVKWFQSIPCSM